MRWVGGGIGMGDYGHEWGVCNLIDVVAQRQIVVVAVISWRDGDPLNGAGAVEKPGRNRRCDDCLGYAEGQARIQVITPLVNVGIVLREDGRVEPILTLNGRARIVIVDEMTA
jgi:hypothetical protein